MHNVVREQSSCIDLSLTLFKFTQILSATLLIITKESSVINEICTRRNCFVLNVSPLLCRHLTLYNVNVRTKRRKSLTILTFSHAKILANISCIHLSFCRRSIHRRKPLCKKRYGLIISHICNVIGELLFDDVKNNTIYICSKQTPQVIITTILTYKRSKLLNNVRIILSHILKNHSEQTSLTKTTTNISGEEQPT